MSSNIIPFPRHLRERRIVSDKDPTANEEKHRVFAHMKLRQIQKRYDEPGDRGLLKWGNAEDRLRAAQALGNLIHNKGKKDVSLATLKNRWRELNHESEFHMHRYAISPDIDLCDPRIAAEQANKIKIWSVRPYAERARFVAELKALDLVESEISIFRNTSLWRSTNSSSLTDDKENEADATADKLAFLLQELCVRVIRDSGLTELFARMRRVRGAWDIRTDRFRASGMDCLSGTAFQDWYEVWEEAPPLPSVPLFRLWHAGLGFTARVSIAGTIEPIDAQEMRKPLTPEESDERQGELHIYREIRIALGPTVKADTLGPLFESRVHAELRIFGHAEETSSQGVLDFDTTLNLRELNSECSAGLLLEDRWHRITPLAELDQTEDQLANDAAAISGLHVESPFMWDQTPLANEKKCFEQYYLSWTPVDSAHVAHWLDREKDGMSQPIDFLPQISAPKAKTTDCTWYSRRYLAHDVETAIGDGRLEAALRARIDHIRSSFEVYEIEWLAHMEEQTAEQVARFRDDLPPTANPEASS